MKRVQFGNPILRQQARELSRADVLSTETKQLIADMQQMLKSKKLGVGLAAPQVGSDVALAIICIQPTEHRPDVEPFEAVIINPKIVETYGRRAQLWEGCISAGSGGKADLFAKVPRYKKVKLTYYDADYQKRTEILEGLKAHIIQHEVDHLNGILFVDRVKDTKSYMTYSEYLKHVKSTSKKS